LQTFPEAAGIFFSSNPPIEIRQYFLLGLSIELFEFFQGPLVKPINPTHASLPWRSRFYRALSDAEWPGRHLPNPRDVQEWLRAHKRFSCVRFFWRDEPGVFQWRDRVSGQAFIEPNLLYMYSKGLFFWGKDSRGGLKRWRQRRVSHGGAEVSRETGMRGCGLLRFFKGQFYTKAQRLTEVSRNDATGATGRQAVAME